MVTSNSSGLKDVKSVFTRWAPLYDLTHALPPYRAAACRALDLRPGERVLDLGGGTGLTLARLRRGVGAGGEVVGADLTPAMLEVARRRVARHGWTNVHLIEGDAAHLTFGDSSFDKILVAFSLSSLLGAGDHRDSAALLHPGAYLWPGQAGPRSLRLQPEPTNIGAWTHPASQRC